MEKKEVFIQNYLSTPASIYIEENRKETRQTYNPTCLSVLFAAPRERRR